MGLSNEERISKFYMYAMGWRKALHTLASKVEDERVSWYTNERADDIVKGWIHEVDWMVGHVQQARGNRGNTFWLLGEGDDTLRGLLSEPYGIDRDADVPDPVTQAVYGEPEYETVRWWSQEADYAFTASRLQFPPFKSHEKLEALAVWWDAYGYMSGLAYPLYRYDDKLFSPELHERFLRLCGEIINRRFDVCFGSDAKDAEKTERYLLLKHSAFHALLAEAERGLKGDDYFKKTFDGFALYERVAKMGPKDLHELFERIRKEKEQQDQKYHDERAKVDATRGPKPDGLFGPKPETPAEQKPVKKAKRARRR